jgi:polar amino acid transport system permease protein
MRYIILPQALRMAAPPLTSQMIALVKDSALVSTISIYDMTMQAQRLVSETYLVFEIWFTVAGIYLLINLMLSMLVKFVNMKVYE